tara:strand:+ start:60 stop:440 length:381 start_codon:yes stop_codon:yes gene_type:complete
LRNYNRTSKQRKEICGANNNPWHHRIGYVCVSNNLKKDGVRMDREWIINQIAWLERFAIQSDDCSDDQIGTMQFLLRENGLPSAEVISDTVYLNGLASGASIPIKAVAKSLACVLWSKLVDQKITV